MRKLEGLLLAIALVQLGACERPERSHNDQNQPSGTEPGQVSSSKAAPSQRQNPQIEAQRNNAGADVGMPKASAGTSVSGQPDANRDVPRDPSAASDASQSAGPSAAGRVETAPADEARVPVQEGTRAAPYGHDTSTLADERPRGAEPVTGR